MPHGGHQIRVLTGGLGLIEHPQRALAHLGRVLLVHRVPSLLQERNETQADSLCSLLQPQTLFRNGAVN